MRRLIIAAFIAARLAIRRQFALLRVRSLEIELQGANDTLALPLDADTYAVVSAARQLTRRELTRARADYNALLPVGERRTWVLI